MTERTNARRTRYAPEKGRIRAHRLRHAILTNVAKRKTGHPKLCPGCSP